MKRNRNRHGKRPTNENVAERIRRAQAAVRKHIPRDDLDVTPEVLEERKRDAALAAAQKYFCGLAPRERVFSEELLQERRDESKRE